MKKRRQFARGNSWRVSIVTVGPTGIDDPAEREARTHHRLELTANKKKRTVAFDTEQKALDFARLAMRRLQTRTNIDSIVHELERKRDIANAYANGTSA